METTSNPTTTTEGMRQLLELAISCGRSWQSPQTGYIHYCYTIQDEESHHPIPILENMLFALALMRSRKTDNVTEAKETLNRLLYFQNKEGDFSHGNFPIYLHEYPICKDRLLGAHLLAPLYWIHHGFHNVLGADLKSRLEIAMESTLKHALKTHLEKPAPYHIAIKIAAAAKAIGKLLQKADVEREGDALLKALRESPDMASWCSPLILSDILAGLQMAYPSISDSPWSNFWRHLICTWHCETSTYAGPGWREFQKGLEPQPTLYDYYMGYFSGSYNYRSFFDHPIQLQAALVHPSVDKLDLPASRVQLAGSIGTAPWEVYQTSGYAVALLGRKAETSPYLEKMFIPFKLVWGDKNRVHSLVSQGGASRLINFKRMEDTIEMVCTLGDEVNVEDREKTREVAFFVDAEESTRITVGGIPATTFQMGEEVVIEDARLRVAIKFLLAGEGQFFGHIMKGNRPSQVNLRGPNLFNAYDWQIFLRTVRRGSPCSVKAVITIASKT